MGLSGRQIEGVGACGNHVVSHSVVNSQLSLVRWFSGERRLLPSLVNPWSSRGGRRELTPQGCPPAPNALLQVRVPESKGSPENQNLFPKASHNYRSLLFQHCPLLFYKWTHHRVLDFIWLYISKSPFPRESYPIPRRVNAKKSLGGPY